MPDRNPDRHVYKQMGLSWRRGFARPGDFVKDDLSILHSDLAWAINGS